MGVDSGLVYRLITEEGDLHSNAKVRWAINLASTAGVATYRLTFTVPFWLSRIQPHAWNALLPLEMVGNGQKQAVMMTLVLPLLYLIQRR